MGQGATSILVVDAHWLERLGLVNLFATAPQFGHVFDATTAAEAVAKVRAHAPDVVVIDTRLPDGSGIDACRQIRLLSPNTRVLVLTPSCDEDAVIGAMLAGAGGYLLKHTDPGRVITAVETVASGGSVLDAAVSETLAQWMRRAAATRPRGGDRLSEHERKILPLIAEGKTNRQIGAELYLSEHTVKTYVSSLLKKLHLARRAEAAAYIARAEHARAA